MKVIILKDNFRDGLNAVEKTTAENVNLPILKNVLIKTFNNRIQISATNLELAVTKFISGKIIEDGSITVPLSALLSIINNLNAERVNLEVKNNILTLKTDNYEAIIQGLPEEEFPIIPKIENTENYLRLDNEILKEGLLKVINAVQISELRPELSGILLDFQITNFKLAGTDSFRLAEKTINENNFKCNFSKGFKIIIPLKTIQEFLRIPISGEITILTDLNQILFKNDDLEIISRLISGNYPDYEQVIPKTLESEVIFEREQLLSAVKLVSTFSGKINDIKINAKEGKKSLEIYSANQYLGENKYLVPVKMKGEIFNLSFNWRYFVDGLKNFNNSEIFLGVSEGNHRSIIKDPKDASYFYILMPINP
ncbi:MAG: DNA polymerase III subunit beta [Candidatus Harrisonbacteria bacterium RIFCSPLOWO2_02_FULL_41_11]|uniref:Beta sliding clamp n=1 Tax=Candidatus Harrisonbacteria bacterium RIFCSPHIGHO2_02_FULL_42_16 TaxID=1798404 RepID=A0A1G1ZHR2_9BACT|nr:MAG: DNA polymerase III subunit beta [Candidatus Harrisonbacteria bacterium RIFCSPHIGHO2_02_FULL_42_16]OGY67120.1 MAG: DNA polymerase III subunit beta [Candidatus Harrisonbacteria bacterium RIFCSPLOWO2_02_FULL_41_11]